MELKIARLAPTRQYAIEELRSAITTGKFLPGERLIERELCERLRVSRTVVRETLRQLETEGLVTTIAYRGPVVTLLTPAEAAGIYQVRAALESLAARLFAARAIDTDQARLKSMLDDVATAYAAGEPTSILDAKAKFYEALVAGSGNPVIGSMLRQILARTMLLRSLSLSKPGRSQQSIAELRAIVDAIFRRDADGASRASTEHVEQAAAVALQVLQGASLTKGRPRLEAAASTT